MLFSDQGFLLYCCFCAALFGAVLGSALNCAAYRAVHGGSWVKGRSRCPACGHVLGARDLVPVFSWLLLRGKCRYCGTKISPRYVLAELLCAGLAAACVARFGLTALCLRNLAFLFCLFFLSLVDWESFIIPDGCLLVAAGAWLLALPFPWNGWRDAASRVLAGLVFGGVALAVSLALDKLLGKESLGGGDIKLLAVCGLYLGWIGSLFALLLACVLGLALAAALRRGRGEPVPFGPAIAAASAVMLFCGDAVTAWYLGFF